MFNHLKSESHKPSRILVLGSRGFIGKQLIAELTRQNINVLGVSSSEIDLTSPGSAESLAKILKNDDCLVFASAITPDKGRDIRAVMKNLTMAENVASALTATPCAHVIYISSDAVFGEDLPPIQESTPVAPTNLYGTMHLMREKMIASVLEKSKTPYLILRPSALYGPGDTHNSYGPNRFIRTSLKEKKINIFGQGEEKRPHLYIEDFVAILVKSILQQTTGLIHVVPKSSVSFGEIAQIVAQSAKNGTQIEPLPRSGPVTHKHFDPSNILRAFPKNSFTSLESGIQNCLKSPF